MLILEFHHEVVSPSWFVTRLNLFLHSTKKWSFSLKISPVNVTKSAVSCYLVRLTGEILNGKLHFLCNVLCLIGISRFFKEPAENVCHAFEAFSWGCILLELENTSFLHIIFKLFFRVTGFTRLLRVFSRFSLYF